MPIQDGAIAKKQFHTYTPYTTSFNLNDEVRIAIQSQDLFLLPSESYIYLEIEVERKAGNDYAQVDGNWTSNMAAYLFSEMRYEINNIEIDRIKNPGTTGNMKKYTADSHLNGRNNVMQSYYINHNLAAQKYSFMISLNQLFGFCDDYKKIIMNAKHELVMVINRVTYLSYMATNEAFNISIRKIQWRMPHIQLTDEAKLQMLRYMERKQTIHVPYRSWDYYELPQLPQATKHIWTVKSTTQLSRPRFVFVTFQTNKQAVTSNSSAYDPCNATDLKLHLNSYCYSYDNYNSDFDNVDILHLYNDFQSIQKSYYNRSDGENSLQYGLDVYTQHPIFCFDCSQSDESLIGGAVDIRLEINTSENIPANTKANCVIIYDNFFEYSPFSSITVKKP